MRFFSYALLGAAAMAILILMVRSALSDTRRRRDRVNQIIEDNKHAEVLRNARFAKIEADLRRLQALIEQCRSKGSADGDSERARQG